MSHRQKLDWAAGHISLLADAIEEYQVSYPFRAHPEYTPAPPFVDGTEVHVEFCFEIVNQIPSHLPLLIGDCLTNLRASLDHLVYRLAKEHSQTFTDKVRIQFPITSNPSSFIRQLRGTLSHLPAEVSAALTWLQPFAERWGGRPRHAHPLKLLNDLVNVDKHRAVLIIPAPSYARAIFSVNPPITEPYGTAIRNGPYRTGDIIGTVEFIARDPTTQFWLEPNEIDVAVVNPDTSFTSSALYSLREMHDHISRVVFPALEPFLNS